MYCTYCGKEMDASAKFCPACGQPVVQETEAETQKPQNPIPKPEEQKTKPKRKKKTLIAVLALLLVVAIGAGVGLNALFGKRTIYVVDTITLSEGGRVVDGIVNYDAEGNLSTIEFSGEGGPLGTVRCTYDERGYPCEMLACDSENQSGVRWTYTYGLKGERLSQYEYIDGDQSCSYEYIYDNLGTTRIGANFYITRGPEYQIDYIYEDGKLAEEESFDSDRYLAWHCEYIYDNKGNLTNRMRYSNNNEKSWEERYTNDKKGNLVEIISDQGIRITWEYKKIRVPKEAVNRINTTTNDLLNDLTDKMLYY